MSGNCADPLWLCPLCRGSLARTSGSLRCPQGHCFDYAREGYVNLLPVNRKRSREPGDSREMIDARRRVHVADLYRPLVDALARLLAAECGAAPVLLDLGCGEGYYSKCVQQALAPALLYGIDIAKPAVRLAAKTFPEGHFAVASAFAVPLPDASVDAVFCVFAPRSEAELARLVKPGGCFIEVSPGEHHLWELRQLIYDTPRPHKPPEAPAQGFAPLQPVRVQFDLPLRGSLLRDLLAMTPYAHGGQREHKSQLENLDALDTRAEFLLSVYRRTG